MALWFSVILNVNLAIINMLPIPVLDGGHIVLALIEAVRRKPVNMRVLEVIQTGCAVLIIGYMPTSASSMSGPSLASKAQPTKSLPAQRFRRVRSVAARDLPRRAFPKQSVRALLSFACADPRL